MVTDDSPNIPTASDADDPLAEDGRGLALVAAFTSARTGYYFTDAGHKVV